MTKLLPQTPTGAGQARRRNGIRYPAVGETAGSYDSTYVAALCPVASVSLVPVLIPGEAFRTGQQDNDIMANRWIGANVL